MMKPAQGIACWFVCFVVLFWFCFCFLLKVHERQWQKSKTQSWVNLRRGLWAFPRVKHGPAVPTWGACSLAFTHCQALLMGQLQEPGTVVGLLGAHKLVLTPPDLVCLGRGHRRTFQTEMAWKHFLEEMESKSR